MSGSRDLSRLDGIVRAPIVNIITETLPGSITIRAYGYEDYYRVKFYNRIDDYFKTRILYSGVSQWFGLTLDLLSLSFLIFLVTFSMFTELTSQQIGLMLTYGLALQAGLFSLLTILSTFENCMVSMERCLRYTGINTENPYELPSDSELASWPQHGHIKFTNYFVKYRPDTELILKNLNFEIQAGHKVGVVGRTGSGKSTLCLCLFRRLEPSAGNIHIDDIDISTIGLKKLRSSLTIIPQDPSLMEGTLRYNIDPLDLYSADAIKSVMESIGF
jgi:ABC-type multidrug transport system fused ATPase/permease subunit